MYQKKKTILELLNFIKATDLPYNIEYINTLDQMSKDDNMLFIYLVQTLLLNIQLQFQNNPNSVYGSYNEYALPNLMNELQQLLARQETLPSPVETKIRLLLHDNNPVLQNYAQMLLASLYVYHQNEYAISEASLHTMLVAPFATLRRPVAARALFLIALHNPSRREAIIAELQKLQATPEPINRIMAARTLQLIDIAEMAHTAQIVPFEQRENLRSTLKSINETDTTLTGPEISWAAGQALTWLDDQSKYHEYSQGSR